MFRAEPFICVKNPIVASWHMPYKKLTGNVRLYVTWARVKHSYEIGICNSVRYMCPH